MGSLRENRRHNAAVLKRLFTRESREGPPDVEKLARRSAIDELVEALGYGEGPDGVLGENVRWEAQGALVEIGEAAIPALVATLERNGRAAEYAARALALMGPAGLTALIAAIRRCRGPEGGAALWAFDGASLVQRGDGGPGLAALIRAMVDRSDPVRRWADHALSGDVTQISASQVLGNAAAGADPEVRTYAAFALASMGDERAVEPLLADVGRDRDVKDAVSALLGVMDPEGLVKKLEGMRSISGLDAIFAVTRVIGEDLRRKADTASSLAAVALARLGDKRAVESLISVLEDAGYRPVSFDTRRAAIDALGSLGDRRAIPALVRHRHEIDVRFRVIVALEQLGGPDAAHELGDCLLDGYVYTRVGAVEALHTIADRDGAADVVGVLPRLLDALQDPSVFDVWTGSHPYGASEVENLRDTERQSWEHLRSILVAIGEPARAALVQIAEGPNSRAGIEARKVLAAIDGGTNPA